MKLVIILKFTAPITLMVPRIRVLTLLSLEIMDLVILR